MRKSPPGNAADHQLATAAAATLGKARDVLTARMNEAGLTTQEGWRISEQIRHTVEGTVWVFRPIHSRMASPTLATSVGLNDMGHVTEVLVTE